MPHPDPSVPVQDTGQRSRRSREQVETRLREAARALFAERGYAGATTKEIARRAEVSETLLFRYFGGKAALFDEVVSGPFNSLMQHFMALHPKAEPGRAGGDTDEFVDAVYRLFQDNKDVLGALLAAPGQIADGRPPQLGGLEGYFDKAVALLDAQYAQDGAHLDVDRHVAVRICFGMVAATVLLGDWLFPRGRPDEATVTEALRRMTARALKHS